jgi:hypothetical protein
MQNVLVRELVVFFILLLAEAAQAAPKAELWPRWQRHDPSSSQKIDHGVWDRFLREFVVANHPSGINRVRYQAVTPEAVKSLKGYLQALQELPIANYNRAEQKAYWINLYNALTVDIVISRYPLASIRDVNISPGLFTRGPWGAKRLTVEGGKLSLDDVEHRILRPIWKDNRVHYAVNCASLGCPNLQPAAYTAENTDSLLEKGGQEYINHPRGVAIKNGKLQVSSIYVWFQEDFGGNSVGLMEHWQEYAERKLADALSNYSGGLAHDYDWRLNGIQSQP